MLYKCKDTISFSILHIYTMSFFIIIVQQTYLTLRLNWIQAWQSPHSPLRRAFSAAAAAPLSLSGKPNTPRELAPNPE